MKAKTMLKLTKIRPSLRPSRWYPKQLNAAPGKVQVM
jgi:hypothetical protein